ncbi:MULTISPECIES: hypothetical protein [unclassified Polaromonas]|uniref:hypothetical protein n=1 Tax=unclassified Polaromonas TaxID=2638319 RepID=UPI0018C9C04E|nr:MULTISPECIES: hypothetical protein [unclassified Polaromonas]MBG6074126.1 hypothetical protein [Polaromonas sp. CG_9.7]MBG6116137.1 hypothetical protein [Polaromonas sp. CG_9.2]MDH6185338.1 hypothetical protein [Polaromonas sp. CG_23.6]
MSYKKFKIFKKFSKNEKLKTFPSSNFFNSQKGFFAETLVFSEQKKSGFPL